MAEAADEMEPNPGGPAPAEDAPTTTLDRLPVGARAVVRGLIGEGAQRRRMLDLGLVAGTLVEVGLRSPLGDPVAYRVRGSTVALRREQARQVVVSVEGE